jgi:hypothetical protein
LHEGIRLPLPDKLREDPTRDRVTGALVWARFDGSERVLAADLVVDAMGRGACTPAFSDSLGLWPSG